MRKLKQWIKRSILDRVFAPYIVRARFHDGKRVRRVTHYAWTWHEALQWVACYSPGDVRLIQHHGLLADKPRLIAAVV